MHWNDFHVSNQLTTSKQCAMTSVHFKSKTHHVLGNTLVKFQFWKYNVRSKPNGGRWKKKNQQHIHLDGLMLTVQRNI